MKTKILTIIAICIFTIANAQEKANYNTVRNSKGRIIENNGDVEAQRNNKKRCERQGGTYSEDISSGSWMCKMPTQIKRTKSVTIIQNDENIQKNGQKKCTNSGGTFFEYSNGTYICLYKNVMNEKSKKRKKQACFETGGVWVNGEFCLKQLSLEKK